jgi:exodeoxyribonuclease VII small subunit
MATGGGERQDRPARPGAGGDSAATAAAKAGGGKNAGNAGKAKSAAKSDGAANGAGSEGVRIPYEKARDELTDLVKRLEAGGLTLEQSLELWERGERLAAICEEWLEGARARLAAAMAQRSDGEPDPGSPF